MDALATTEPLVWAARQPLAYRLVLDKLVLAQEFSQARSRFAVLRRIASEVFRFSDEADVWLVTPTAELGGFSPLDLANESQEGSQLALRTLIL